MIDFSSSCLECGASQVDGMGCWEQLGGILAWEWDDPELMRQHFLTVASYNLQHPAQFTEEAIDKLRQLFIEHLDEGVPVYLLRRRVGRDSAGSKRVRRKVADRVMVKRDWQMTVADVYLAGRREGAAVRVREWAESIRREFV
ncbi:MAG TPA: DUF5946 family protein [Anaerolineae bacterium]|nr:DUF5946 family protein [Anaerolineae bacterium]